jgi:LPXTG-motif cell wall-anchored protein
MGRALVCALTVVGFAEAGSGHVAADSGDADRITLCHATGSGRWVPITVAPNAALNGHGHHFDDVVPAFTFRSQGRTAVYAGSNLGRLAGTNVTGQALLQAGCSLPATTRTTADIPAVTASTPSIRPPAATAPIATPTIRPPATTLAPLATPTTRPTATTLAPLATPTTRPTAEVCGPGQWSYQGTCYLLPSLVVPPKAATADWRSAATAPVPVVECVDPENDRIWFGYELSGTAATSIPIGSDNSVTDARTSPPSLFGPGLHTFVFSAPSDTAWTLAGTTVRADSSTSRCGDRVDVGSVDTTTATQTAVTTTTAASSATCTTGQVPSQGRCVAVAAPVLVLVDNELECDGHGLAQFALFDPNDVPIPSDAISLELSPDTGAFDRAEYVAAGAGTDVQGNEVAAVVAVRYVRAVTWTVGLAGNIASISAGSDGLSPPAECAEADTVALGRTEPRTGSHTPDTGGSTRAQLLAAGLVMALGVGFVLAARRRVRPAKP